MQVREALEMKAVEAANWPVRTRETMAVVMEIDSVIGSGETTQRRMEMKKRTQDGNHRLQSRRLSWRFALVVSLRHPDLRSE